MPGASAQCVLLVRTTQTTVRSEAGVERIALDDHDRAAEAGLRPCWVAEVRPPHLALGDHHSEDSSVRRPRLPEVIRVHLADVDEDRVQAGGHLVRRVTGEVLAERGAVHLAPRAARAPGEAVSLGEQVVGHRDGGLHTASITIALRCLNP